MYFSYEALCAHIECGDEHTIVFRFLTFSNAIKCVFIDGSIWFYETKQHIHLKLLIRGDIWESTNNLVGPNIQDKMKECVIFFWEEVHNNYLKSQIIRIIHFGVNNDKV